MSPERRFLGSFMLLSVVSGLTVGLGKIVSTLYAIQLGATPFQIGIVSAMESVGMILVAVPAGFVIARYGARGAYFVASLGPLLVNLLLPFSGSWIALAAGRGLIGLCIPFRMVSMNGAFLERLKTIGQGKAGWYRGAMTIGTAIVGPAVASALTTRIPLPTIFLLVAALFGAMALFSQSFLPARDDVAEAAASPGFLAELKLITGHPAVAESCLIEFAGSATTALFGTFIILLAAGLPGLTAQDGIHVLLFQGGTSVVMLFLGGAATARLGRNAAYGASLALAASALVSLGLAGGFVVLAAGAILLSAGASLIHLVNMRMLAGLPGGKSKIAGLYNLASMTGASFGAISGGALTKLVPLQHVFLFWLIVLVVLAVGVTLLHRRSGSARAARLEPAT